MSLADYYRDKPCSDNPNEINVREAKKLIGRHKIIINDTIMYSSDKEVFIISPRFTYWPVRFKTQICLN